MIALREQGRMADAIKLAHAVLNALWTEEKNTGDPATLKSIIAACGLDADAVMKAGAAPEMAAKRDAYTKHAIAESVFGAPFFVIDGERLGSGRPPDTANTAPKSTGQMVTLAPCFAAIASRRFEPR